MMTQEVMITFILLKSYKFTFGLVSSFCKNKCIYHLRCWFSLKIASFFFVLRQMVAAHINHSPIKTCYRKFFSFLLFPNAFYFIPTASPVFR